VIGFVFAAVIGSPLAHAFNRYRGGSYEVRSIGTSFAKIQDNILSMVIQHHQGDINMAKLLPGKTQRPQLLALGQNIIKAQSSEMQQMHTWQKQ